MVAALWWRLVQALFSHAMGGHLSAVANVYRIGAPPHRLSAAQDRAERVYLSWHLMVAGVEASTFFLSRKYDILMAMAGGGYVASMDTWL